MQGVSSRYLPGPTPCMREPLRFRHVTLAPPQRFFRPLCCGDVHYRSNKLDFARLISLSMSHNADILHETEFVGAVIDRKSTRLNSSHVSISYAVFCL